MIAFEGSSAERHSTPSEKSAPPLIVLPDISPRIVTGRKTLSPKISPTPSGVERGAKLAASPFSPFTGRRCRQADEGQRRRWWSPQKTAAPVS
ncbi:hypothetical protein EJ066_04480 [Mesorhizobium sp. M9A.F.Ca.ET.002.03.1.2]|nr:hypothetical protein EJ066_04480 [Mesorhizobium sp. M9A.F.Ca.ET.002.03.1.2]